jgi:hypothetical protein
MPEHEQGTENRHRPDAGWQRPVRSDQPAVYRIQVQGRLREGWSDWFDGMTLEVDTIAQGLTITTLTGPVADQSALHGRLMRIRDLGLTLLAVECLSSGRVEE